MRLEDGATTTIGGTLVDWVHGADWGEDDRIVYSRSFTGIWRLPVQGGEAEQITDPSNFDDEYGHMWPQSLGEGRLLLFSALGPSGKWHDSKIVLKDLETGSRFVVVEGAAYGRYIPTGHIVYANGDGDLIAVPFDMDGRSTGDAFPVTSGVLLGQWGGGASFAVSPTGTLIFVRASGLERHLLYWYDRSGQRLSQLGSTMTAAWGLEVEPGGRRVATTLPNNQNDDVHLLEEQAVNPRRLTFAVESDEWPVWSPDGSHIAWVRYAGGGGRVLMTEVESGVEVDTLFQTQNELWPRSWSPDGRWLALSVRTPDSGLDVVAVDVHDPSNVISIASGPSEEWDPQISPDGNWIAYDSDETGQLQTYVAAFPSGEGANPLWQEGGVHPRWSPDSNELFFWQGTTLMAAAYRTEPTFTVAEVRELFSEPDYVVSDDPYYDVTSDGFLIQLHNRTSGATEIRVVQNFFEELRQVVPDN